MCPTIYLKLALHSLVAQREFRSSGDMFFYDAGFWKIQVITQARNSKSLSPYLRRAAFIFGIEASVKSRLSPTTSV